MFRIEKRGGWVDHPWERPDLDEVDDDLAALTFRTGTYLDAYWHLTIEFDINERLSWRAKQKAYLARYGKQSSVQWDKVDVSIIDEQFAELGGIVREENALSKVTED